MGFPERRAGRWAGPTTANNGCQGRRSVLRWRRPAAGRWDLLNPAVVRPRTFLARVQR